MQGNRQNQGKRADQQRVSKHFHHIVFHRERHQATHNPQAGKQTGGRYDDGYVEHRIRGISEFEENIRNRNIQDDHCPDQGLVQFYVPRGVRRCHQRGCQRIDGRNDNDQAGKTHHVLRQLPQPQPYDERSLYDNRQRNEQYQVKRHLGTAEHQLEHIRKVALGIILDDLKANLSNLTTTKEKGEYFASDFKNLFSAFKNLAKSGTLDQVKDVSELNQILNILTSDENITVLQSALENVFSMNTIQDSISSVIKIAFEKILNEEVSDLEDTSGYTDEQWKNLSAKFTNILKMVGDINGGFSGGLEGVIKDPESILDESSETLSATLSNVGSLLDELLNIDLFKTTTGENTTIFDGILTNYNLTLPSGTVLKVNTNESGELVKEEVKISSYKELFEFITPTLITVKDNDLYNIITSGSDVQSLLQTLADKIAKNEEGAVVGDRYLLHKIILPLYQIEFTNELIVSNLQTALGANEIITFANIDTLAEWESELDYISDLITKVNTTSVNIGSQEDPDNQTYLQIILSGDYNTLINNLQEEDVDGIFRPILEAQCTENLKVQVLDLISTNIQKVTNAQTTIPTDNASQNVDEIIEIIKSFISLNKVLSEAETTINSLIENPDNTDVLGETLNTIRDMVLDENGDIDENSAFGGVLDDLVGTIRNEYNDVLLENEDIAQELADANLQNVDFVDVLNRLRDVIG